MRLRAAYSFFRRRTSAELAPLGMSADQFVLLTVLAQDGPATQQELVRRCPSDTTTLGAMVALLETKKLVKRQAHAADGRAWVVSLTRAGRARQKQLWDGTEDLRAELTGLFRPDEAHLLLQLLDRIIGALEPPTSRSRKTAALAKGFRKLIRPKTRER